jgi:leader peptidase (prepilin peptidase) / N-methyltransferase
MSYQTISDVTKALLILSLIFLAYIDWRSFRLPNLLTLPLIALGLSFNSITELGFTTISSALLGAILAYGSIWILNAGYQAIRGRNGIGMGDAKLFAALGAWLGWSALPSILLMASFLGLIGGLAFLYWQKRDIHQAFPFGPFLAIAGIIELLWPQIIPTLVLPRLI